MNPAQKLITHGQSLWYDNISRDIIDNGELKRMIGEWGVRGLTSNPTIFDQAISKSSLYDSVIAEGRKLGSTPDKIFEEIAVGDIALAADLFRGVFEESKGDDGFVSIEVSPLLAADTNGTIEEAKRLWKRLNRPNIMIKIPGTPEGIPAIRAALEAGINVNVTLLFSVENYVKVAQTYVDALRARVKRGESVENIRSVASFFVSRVDTIIDSKLDAIAKGSDPAKAEKAKSLLGKFGVANCKLAYEQFEKIFIGAAFDDLKHKNAAVQRPLWASTSMKNPNYRDVMYVESLIGAHTVNTMPPQTVAATVDHAVVEETLSKGLNEAKQILADLGTVGVDVSACLHELQVDGVKKFAESFKALNETIKKKLG
jgi:transaldolase